MDDQGKRLLLAVAVAFAIVLVWNAVQTRFFPPPEPPPGEQVPGEQVTDAGSQEGHEPTETPGDGPETPKGPKLAEPDGASDGASDTAGPKLDTPAEPAMENRCASDQLGTFEFTFDGFRAVFTSEGGSLRSWQLQGQKYRTADDSGPHQMDLVPNGDDPRLRQFALRFDERDDWWPETTTWCMTEKTDTTIAFKWSYFHPSRDSAIYEITKKYELFPADYLVQMTIGVINKEAAEDSETVVVSLFGYQDPSVDTEGGWASLDTAWKSACLINDEVEEATFKDLTESPKKRIGKLLWGGFNHSYFFVAAAPKLDADSRLSCSSAGYKDVPGAMRTDIAFPSVKLRKNHEITYVLSAYLGPKYLDKLEAIPATIDHNPRFEESIDFGWFGILARPLLGLLQWFHSFLGNWGLAIILLTVVVKLATLYWNTKAMRSMRKMAKLKPQMEAIQKKYQDDKQKQQQEVMNLYRAHGVNPVAGCLPMFLQMPIWFALYRTLMAAAELYHAPFIPGWIDDLTGVPDLSRPAYLVMPIALMGMMFLQARLSPTTPDSTQQKIMMYGLPLMFGVFGFFFPAGLTLYMLTNTVLTSLHNVWMNRTDPQGQGGADKGAEKAAGKGGKADGKGSDADGDSGDSDSTGDKPVRASAKKPSDGVKRGKGSKSRRRGGKRKRNPGN